MAQRTTSATMLRARVRTERALMHVSAHVAHATRRVRRRVENVWLPNAVTLSALAVGSLRAGGARAVRLASSWSDVAAKANTSLSAVMRLVEAGIATARTQARSRVGKSRRARLYTPRAGGRASGAVTRRLAHVPWAQWVLLVVAMLIVGASLALTPRALASISWSFPRASSPATTRTHASAGVPIVLHPPAKATPVATLNPAPAYLVGAWMSSDLPPQRGEVTIFVSVTDSRTQRPVGGISVSASVRFTCASAGFIGAYGPVLTDGSGLAALPIYYSMLPLGKPNCVIVTAHTAAGDFSASTAFAAS